VVGAAGDVDGGPGFVHEGELVQGHPARELEFLCPPAEAAHGFGERRFA
jgi:hypothetical protein